jgi:hypothetical protein
MAKSDEFDRDEKPDTKEVTTRTGPLGYLPLLYIGAVIVFIIIIALLWWWQR